MKIAMHLILQKNERDAIIFPFWWHRSREREGMGFKGPFFIGAGG